MIRRIPRLRLPVGSGLELLLVGGAAYFASEHEQGRHGQPHMLCLICWLNRIAPVTEPSGESPAAPEE
jgi:hypothetical protein